MKMRATDPAGAKAIERIKARMKMRATGPVGAKAIERIKARMKMRATGPAGYIVMSGEMSRIYPQHSSLG